MGQRAQAVPLIDPSSQSRATLGTSTSEERGRIAAVRLRLREALNALPRSRDQAARKGLQAHREAVAQVRGRRKPQFRSCAGNIDEVQELFVHRAAGRQAGEARAEEVV